MFKKDKIRIDTFLIKEKQTLENFLREKMPFLKQTNYKKILSEKRLFLNGESLTNTKIRLQKGDLITFETPINLEPKINKNINILFEDEHLIVLDKPPNLPVHPAGKYYFNTLLKLLEDQLNLKLYLINRLDKETSGLLLIAKNKEVLIKMQDLFSKGTITKKYFAIVFGTPKKKDFMIKNYLIKKNKLTKQNNIIRDHMVVSDEKSENGTIAQTRVIEKFSFNKNSFKKSGLEETYSLLEISLLTGKRHQIRAHLSDIGLPIVGDKQYGKNPDLFVKISENEDLVSEEEIIKSTGAKRQLLHCFKLVFEHPLTKELLSFEIDLPEDMKEFINDKK